MPIIMRTVTQNFLMAESVMVVNSGTIQTYGTVEGADRYFDSVLEGQLWMDTDRRMKSRALNSATQKIERLNFIGTKTDPSQLLQFPRGTDTVVPVDIEYACYHLAQTLLKGIDANTERDNLFAVVQGYERLRSQFDRDHTPLHIRAGIPDATAWELLLPYLDERRDVEIRRVS